MTSRCHGAKFFCSKQSLLTEKKNGASVTQLMFFQSNHAKKRKDSIEVFVTFCLWVLLELRNVNFTLRRSKSSKWFSTSHPTVTISPRPIRVSLSSLASRARKRRTKNTDDGFDCQGLYIFWLINTVIA